MLRGLLDWVGCKEAGARRRAPARRRAGRRESSSNPSILIISTSISISDGIGIIGVMLFY